MKVKLLDLRKSHFLCVLKKTFVLFSPFQPIFDAFFMPDPCFPEASVISFFVD